MVCILYTVHGYICGVMRIHFGEMCLKVKKILKCFIFNAVYIEYIIWMYNP